MYGALFGISSKLEAPVTEQPKPLTTTFMAYELQVPPLADRVGTPVEHQKKAEIRFAHGQVDWLPALALEAGWLPEHLPMLKAIVLRESGGCPNVRGGDVANENCEIVRVREWNHRSDTGLLQINGVNYNLKRNKWARVCLDMGICEQEPLLDPLTNLRAGKLLYDYSGWAPWDPCAWGDLAPKACAKKGSLLPRNP